jgi:hypothetical protein
MNMTPERAAKIIKDLLRTYPQGPKGSKGLKKEDYTKRNKWMPDVGEWRDVVAPVDETIQFFGYSQEDAIALCRIDLGDDIRGDDWRTGEWDWRRAIREIYPELNWKSSAITRRARRISRRVGQEVQSLINGGTLAGCYQISFGYGGNGATVCAYGNDEESAKAVAEMMCSHAFGGERIRYANYVSQDNVGAITSRNNDSVKRLTRRIEEAKKTIKKQQEAIAELERQQAVIEMFSAQQVGAMAEALCAE